MFYSLLHLQLTAIFRKTCKNWKEQGAFKVTQSLEHTMCSQGICQGVPSDDQGLNPILFVRTANSMFEKNVSKIAEYNHYVHWRRAEVWRIEHQLWASKTPLWFDLRPTTTIVILFLYLQKWQRVIPVYHFTNLGLFSYNAIWIWCELGCPPGCPNTNMVVPGDQTKFC